MQPTGQRSVNRIIILYQPHLSLMECDKSLNYPDNYGKLGVRSIIVWGLLIQYIGPIGRNASGGVSLSNPPELMGSPVDSGERRARRAFEETIS